MNLHEIANEVITVVNPNVDARLQASSGYTTLPSGRQQPTYEPIDDVTVQVQPMSTSDINKISALNLQGITRKFYVSGKVESLVRIKKQGGDIISIPCGAWKGVWLINIVIEQWPEWVSVIGTLQNEGIPNG